MKFLFFILGTGLIFSCSKNCDSANEKCQDVPQTGIVCQAYFENWFFEANTNSCSYIGYSGCESVGFANLEECEGCTCIKKD
jgi:hypothetical protein